MLQYPVSLTKNSGGKVRLTVLDVPEAMIDDAVSEEEALHRGKFVLEMCLGHYVLHGRQVPAPSVIAGAPVITTEKFGLASRDAPAERATDPADPSPGAPSAPGGGRY